MSCDTSFMSPHPPSGPRLSTSHLFFSLVCLSNLSGVTRRAVPLQCYTICWVFLNHYRPPLGTASSVTQASESHLIGGKYMTFGAIHDLALFVLASYMPIVSNNFSSISFSPNRGITLDCLKAVSSTAWIRCWSESRSSPRSFGYGCVCVAGTRSRAWSGEGLEQ